MCSVADAAHFFEKDRFGPRKNFLVNPLESSSSVKLGITESWLDGWLCEHLLLSSKEGRTRFSVAAAPPHAA